MNRSSSGADHRDGRPGAAVAATVAAAAFDALPDPVLVVEVGTGRVLLANRAAHAADGLLPRAETVSAAGSPSAGDAGEDARCEMADATGRYLSAGETPLARAARGETFSGIRVDCHGQGGRRRATYHVSAAPLAPSDAEGIAGVAPGPAGPAAVVLRYADLGEAGAAEAALRARVQARDEFVSIATHELKEPLTSILLSLQLLDMLASGGPTVSSQEVSETVSVVRRQGDRLARLIENLLDVSRIEHHRLQVDREALDLCDLVHDCVEQFGEDARRAGSDLRLHACMPCIGYFDRLRVEQVVSNLLSNAIKYGAGRPIHVRLEAGDDTVTLAVADHGIGIAPDDRQRVFERFERATKGHLRRSLGLGLYIVRAIVEAHGGSIALQSEVGVGSTFTVELPRHRLPDRDGVEARDDDRPERMTVER